MKLSELFLNRFLYRDSNQSSETQGAAFTSSDSSEESGTPISSGGAAQDINTGNVQIDGAQLEPGTYPLATLDVSNWGWGQTCAFTSSTIDTVTWGAGTFTSADGEAYAIGAGTTGAMAAKTYIYLDLNVSEIAYQSTTTSSTSVGVGKVLVAVAEKSIVVGTLATFNLSEAEQIIGDNILANTINASKITTGQLVVGTNVGLGTAEDSAGVTTIVGNTVTTGYVNALNITAEYVVASVSLTSPSITGGTIAIGSGNNIFKADSNGIYLGNATFASAPFRVSMSGALTATSATIGNWTVNSTSIYTGAEDHSGYTLNPGDVTLYSDGSNASIHANNFYIDSTGHITANSVTLSGSITATSGSITGSLVTTGISASNISTGTLSAIDVQSGTGNERILLDNGNYIRYYASNVLRASVRGTTLGSGGLFQTGGDYFLGNNRSYWIGDTTAGASKYGGISVTSGNDFWLTMGTDNQFYLYNNAQSATYFTVSSTQTWIDNFVELSTESSNPTSATGAIWHYSSGSDQFRGVPTGSTVYSFDMTVV